MSARFAGYRRDSGNASKAKLAIGETIPKWAGHLLYNLFSPVCE
jgi:hypothetical protein